MTCLLFHFGVLYLSLVGADTSPAANNSDPDRIIAKAIVSTGMRNPQLTPKGFFLRTEGHAYMWDVMYDVTCDVYVSFSGRKRIEAIVVMDGQKEKSVTVIDKNRGWLRDRSKLNEPFRTDVLSARRFTQETEALELLSLALFPSRLKDPAIKKEVLAPKDIKRKKNLAIAASGPSFGSATLFFDKDEGYVSGWEKRWREEFLAEEQYDVMESFLSERQKLGPFTIPVREKIYYNGNLFVDWKRTEFRVFEKELDPKLFEKP